jgi:hypothetical protein
MFQALYINYLTESPNDFIGKAGLLTPFSNEENERGEDCDLGGVRPHWPVELRIGTHVLNHNAKWHSCVAKTSSGL